MQDQRSKDSNLIQRTVLTAPSARLKLAAELERYGARVVSWPRVEIGEPESFTALDEAIENLFGYDWLLFRTGNAAEFFLRRFQKLGHEVGELDRLRVCAIGEGTLNRLEGSHVHVDVISDSLTSEAVFGAIESYAGGREVLGRLNFLVPCASAARDSLYEKLEDAGARIDVVTAYRTVAANPALTQLNALLAGGGIDCIVFTDPEAVQDFAQLWDTKDLSRILSGVAVACIDEITSRSATKFGLRSYITSNEPTIVALLRTIVDWFVSAA